MTPEQRQARMYYHLYETNEGIEEHAKRIVDLEELVGDMWEYIYIGTERDGQRLHDRTRELGIEV